MAGCGRADDEEYSVILKSRDACPPVCAAATWLVWLYFEAALVAPPPAAAGPDTSTAAARIASAPVVVFNIAISIRSETTQTEQPLAFPVRRPIRRLVVPANQDDPAWAKAQETISGCTKNQQNSLAVKTLTWLIIFWPRHASSRYPLRPGAGNTAEGPNGNRDAAGKMPEIKIGIKNRAGSSLCNSLLV